MDTAALKKNDPVTTMNSPGHSRITKKSYSKSWRKIKSLSAFAL